MCACTHVLQVLVQVELDKICQRIEDLRKQVVTSPDKLRAVSQDWYMYMYIIFIDVLG